MPIVFQDPATTPTVALIDGYPIDCLISDTHTLDAEVTEFPVESGSTISDNIRNKPLVVTMECLVSNTPLQFVSNLRKHGQGEFSGDPENDVYAHLLKIRDSRRLVEINTSITTYNNMALESISIPRASGRGDGLQFKVTFRQVEIVVNARGTRVAIPAAQQGGAKGASLNDAANKGIWVNLQDRTWYDTAIQGWRRIVIFPSGSTVKQPDNTSRPTTGDNVTLPSKSKVMVFDDAPLDLGSAKFSNLPNQSAAAVRPLVIAAQGGQPLPFLTGKNVLQVVMIAFSQAVVTRHH